jgi:hypothetical protein
MWNRVLTGVAGVFLLASAACQSPLGREYEYEERMYLGVDGSASLILSASIPALVALRGLPLDPAPAARVDRDEVRRIFEDGGCPVTSVGQPWRRDGRRFVQVRFETDDVRSLVRCGPLSWSTYAFEMLPRQDEDDQVRYAQTVGKPADGNPGDPGWTGREIVGFKLHLPSRIDYHNVRRLEDGTPGTYERGNILSWEQYLSDRRAGAPVEIEVVMGAQSILNRTLLLFGLAFAGAVALLGSAIWLTVRRGRRQAAAAGAADGPGTGPPGRSDPR